MNQPVFAYVDCPGDPTADIEGCGTQGLTIEQYERQLRNPWATWRCPCCGGGAQYNDDLSEKAQGISAEAAEPPADEWPAMISI